MPQLAARQPDSQPQGFIVWDRQGIVVRWPDGSSHRFSWETLHHISQCEACHEQSQQRAPLAHRSVSLTLSQAT
jgi:hypothetical protein